jgi:hypothetical protein
MSDETEVLFTTGPRRWLCVRVTIHESVAVIRFTARLGTRMCYCPDPFHDAVLVRLKRLLDEVTRSIVLDISDVDVIQRDDGTDAGWIVSLAKRTRDQQGTLRLVLNPPQQSFWKPKGEKVAASYTSVEDAIAAFDESKQRA